MSFYSALPDESKGSGPYARKAWYVCGLTGPGVTDNAERHHLPAKLGSSVDHHDPVRGRQHRVSPVGRFFSGRSVLVPGFFLWPLYLDGVERSRTLDRIRQVKRLYTFNQTSPTNTTCPRQFRGRSYEP